MSLRLQICSNSISIVRPRLVFWTDTFRRQSRSRRSHHVEESVRPAHRWCEGVVTTRSGHSKRHTHTHTCTQIIFRHRADTRRLTHLLAGTGITPEMLLPAIMQELAVPLIEEKFIIYLSPSGTCIPVVRLAHNVRVASLRNDARSGAASTQRLLAPLSSPCHARQASLWRVSSNPTTEARNGSHPTGNAGSCATRTGLILIFIANEMRAASTARGVLGECQGLAAYAVHGRRAARLGAS